MSTSFSTVRGRVMVVASVVLGVGLMAVGLLPTIQDARVARAVNRAGHVEAASMVARRAGCTGVRTDGASEAGQHLFGPIEYEHAPPSSGAHNPDPLADSPRFYDVAAAPAPERAVHSLEHGFVVVWFDRRLPSSDVSVLREATRTIPRLLAVAWTRGNLEGPPLAITAWGRTQRCSTPNLLVMREFTNRYGDRSPEAGGPGGSLAPASQVGTRPS